MATSSARDNILDAAERRARSGGYHGFSFRDLAEDVGVKSSSVHYHFPTKSDLARALAQRYTEQAREFLGDPKSLGPAGAIERLTLMFRNALLVEDKMCLCGLFAAERDVLPEDVEQAVSAFFEMALAYLKDALSDGWAGDPPIAILARLEGALIIARSLRNPDLFEQAVGND